LEVAKSAYGKAKPVKSGGNGLRRLTWKKQNRILENQNPV
jgi:hypothetical protein